MHPESPILSLFSGIGGFEVGLRKAGFHGPIDAYENWKPARSVLAHRFPKTTIHDDVRALPRTTHGAHLLVAGFPCTDLSQAGMQAGIDGSASGLIRGVLQAVSNGLPEWVLLENVPNMLWLNRGSAMDVITSALASAGYTWAFRVLDAQHFGVAQRRKRVFLLASRHHDPSRVMFRDIEPGADEAVALSHRRPAAHGFYWTEGNRGVGWGAGVVPTIKGSTTTGIPSAPAVWLRDADIAEKFRTPSIEALEMLQGFTAGWTRHAPPRDRWKLVGNAVAVPVVRWIAEGLRDYDSLKPVDLSTRLTRPTGWDRAGVSDDVSRRVGKVSDRPGVGAHPRRKSLSSLLTTRGSHPLSQNAARGFTGRLQQSNLRHDPAFMKDLVAYSAL